MTERFTSWHFPYVPIRVSVQQREVALEALVDTGFDGGLAVPPAFITNGETPDGYLPWTLADGRQVLLPAYRGIVQLGSFPPFPTVVIPLGDEPIVGRQVSDRFRVVLDHGQQVVVEP